MDFKCSNGFCERDYGRAVWGVDLGEDFMVTGIKVNNSIRSSMYNILNLVSTTITAAAATTTTAAAAATVYIYVCSFADCLPEYAPSFACGLRLTLILIFL